MRRKWRTTVSCVVFAVGATAVRGEQPAPTIYSMEAFCRIVQPMKHSMEGRVPMFFWEHPLPVDSRVLDWQKDGRLRQAIDELHKRGFTIAPAVGDLGDDDAALVIAQELKKAGLPSYLVNAWGIRHPIEGGKHVDSLWAKTPTYRGPSPWNAKGELDWKGEKDWPAQTVYDIAPTVAMYRQEMKRFKEAGIDVAGVWSDYEAGPMPWNFAYQAAQSEAGRKYYPREALASFKAFSSFTADLGAKVLSDAIADPVHEFYPKALVSNYGAAISSEAYPLTDGNLVPGTPHGIGRLNAQMPSVYANSAMLKRFFNVDWGVDQADVDNVYFTVLLQILSAAGANKTEGKPLIPFISQFCADDPHSPYANYALSTPVYRELIRHALLRGTDGFYLFVYGNPAAPDPERWRLESVEALRAAYDEMLEYREFLDQGVPMNFEVPAMRSRGLIWSGLKLKDRCLVRAFTLGPVAKRLELVLSPGRAVVLEAPPDGATYLVDRRGNVRRLQTGR